MTLHFDCVFYYVSDLDRAVRFYSEILGLSLSSQDVVARFHLDGVLIELVPARFRSKRPGAGNARLCLAVSDIETAAGELKAKGVSVGAIETVANGKLAKFADPDGNELVLWQYASPLHNERSVL